MDLIKKLAMGASIAAMSLSLYATPVFAEATASNSNVSDDSFADADATDDDTVVVTVDNTDDSDIENDDLFDANTGGNTQSGNEDNNSLTTDDADATGDSLRLHKSQN